MSKSDNEKLKEEIEEKNKRSNESKREKVKLVKRTRQLEALVSELYQLLSSQDVTMKKITHLSRRSSSNIRHTVSSIEDVEKDVGNAQLRSIRTSEKSATVKDPRIKSMLDKSAPKMRHTIVRSENVEKDVTDAQLRRIPPTEVFTAFKDPSIKSFIEKLGGTCKKTVIGNESEESTTEEFGNLIPQFTETSNTPTTESDEQLTETSGTQLEQNRLSNQRQLNISNVANISIVMHDN